MILNVSGRTDVVAFYTPWFMNRYREGFVDVRNPFNKKLVNKEIKKPILFQVTLTPYKNDIEPNVIEKKIIIEAIKKLSSIVGIDNLYIRYDPIFFSDKYNVEYHKKVFDKMCFLLNGYVRHIIVSFIDNYKNVRKNENILKFRTIKEEDYREIGLSFSKSAKKYNMTVQTCSEVNNLVEYGFKKDDCISHTLAFKLTGKTNFKKWKSRNNKNCNCVEMVDIGVYNSCKHFCKYCYANFFEEEVIRNTNRHNPKSSLLIGELEYDDVIKIRKT